MRKNKNSCSCSSVLAVFICIRNDSSWILPRKCILHRSGIPLISSGTRDYGFYNTGYLQPFTSRGFPSLIVYNWHTLLKVLTFFFHGIRVNSVMRKHSVMSLKHEFQNVNTTKKTLAKNILSWSGQSSEHDH